jgi:hypothetical protein
MAKIKRKLSKAEKRRKKQLRAEYMTIFVRGKQKRVKRPLTIEGMDVDEFIRRNADPIWLVQEEKWELLNELSINETRNALWPDEEFPFDLYEDPCGSGPEADIRLFKEGIVGHLLTQVLGAMMGSFSEDCCGASWAPGTEYIVPVLCGRAIRSNQPQRWGAGVLEPGFAGLMSSFARRLGHWAMLNGDGTRCMPFQPVPVPEKYLSPPEVFSGPVDPATGARELGREAGRCE